MCRATVGATPVKACTWAASSSFSCGVRGTPGWAKTLKRVPELPYAHDGVSTAWLLRAVFTAGTSDMGLLDVKRFKKAKRAGRCASRSGTAVKNDSIQSAWTVGLPLHLRQEGESIGHLPD